MSHASSYWPMPPTSPYPPGGQPVDRGLEIVDLEGHVAQPQLGGYRGG
jgi:hypothetical protein